MKKKVIVNPKSGKRETAKEKREKIEEMIRSRNEKIVFLDNPLQKLGIADEDNEKNGNASQHDDNAGGNPPQGGQGHGPGGLSPFGPDSTGHSGPPPQMYMIFMKRKENRNLQGKKTIEP